MELAGWTNDRLVAERIDRLPQDQWAYGRPNASIVMASFLHVAPGGMRFNGPDLGAWYASASIVTAAAEVGHHLRREAVARSVPAMRRTYRTYTSVLTGDYLDICGRQADWPEVYASDSYVAGQALGEEVRASAVSGIVYDSIRHRGGRSVVGYRPANITEVAQADHFEISIATASREIEVRKLSAAVMITASTAPTQGSA
jgi:hypothetical protein